MTRLFLIFGLSLLSIISYAQAPKSLASALHTTQEKVYCRTDKDIYQLGENLWFNGLILNELTNTPSSKSQTLYVSLKNNTTNELVIQHKYLADSGYVKGHMTLSDSLSDGEYTFLATTSYNVYSEDPVFFKKAIKIEGYTSHGIRIKTIANTTPKNGEAPTLSVIVVDNSGVPLKNARVLTQVYAHGELLSKKKFTPDEQGKLDLPLNIKGHSSENKQVSLVVTNEEETSTMYVNVPSNQEKLGFLLYPEGGSILREIENKVFVKLNEAYDPNEIYIGQVFHKGKAISPQFTFENGLSDFDFTPTGNGKYTIQVLVKDQIVINEKLVFDAIQSGYKLENAFIEGSAIKIHLVKNKNTPADFMAITLEQDNNILWAAEGKIERNELVEIPMIKNRNGIGKVILYNKDGQAVSEQSVWMEPRQNNLNIEIDTDQDTYEPKGEVNMKVKVTDTSGEPVKGNYSIVVVESLRLNRTPQLNIVDVPFSKYYNINNKRLNQKQRQASDNMNKYLITQQYNQKPNITRPEGFFDGVTGRIGTKNTGRIRKTKVFLSTKDDLLRVSEIDSLGRFHFGVDELRNMTNSKLRLKTFPNAYVPIKVDKSIGDIHKREVLAEENLWINNSKIQRNWSSIEFALDDKSTLFLEEVSIKSTKLTYGKKRARFTELDTLNFLEAVPKPGDYYCFAENVLNCRFHTPSSGAGVEVPLIGNRYVVENRGRNPFIELNERDMRIYYGVILPKEINYIEIGPYQLARNFEHMNYTENPELKLVPDYRKTLYWNPWTGTDSDGNIDVVFFTSDVQSEYTIIVEGTDGQGKFGYTQKKITSTHGDHN